MKIHDLSPRTLLFFILAPILLAGVSAQAISNTDFTFEGRALQVDGSTPLTSSSVSFTLSVTGADGSSCVIYEETQGYDLSQTDGYFSLPVGSGTVTANNSGHTMAQIFGTAASIGGKDVNGQACSVSASEVRKLKVKFTDNIAGTTFALSPSIAIGSSPYATVAHSLSGKSASEFAQITASFTQADFESIMAQKTTLLDLATGTSTLYVRANGAGFSPSAAVSFNSQRITNVGAPTGAADAVNKSYADARVGGMSVDSTVAALSGAGADNGKVLAWDSTNQKWTTQTITPAAGSVTNTMLASGIDAAKITTGALPAAQVPDLDASKITTGTFSATQIPSLDGAKIGTGTVAFARLPVGAAANTVAAGDDSRITGALQKSGGTMSGDLNLGGNNITAIANVPFAASAPSAAQDGQTLVWNNGSSSWTWVTPGVAGSGLTNLNGATGTTQSFATPGTSGTAPNWSTASNAHTLNIPMASTASVTAGLLSNVDYTSFSSKFSGSSGGTITGNVTFTGTVALPATSMGGALNMASHAINGVTDPTLAQDAATKHYADTHIGGGAFSTALTGSSGKVLVVNGTEDGFILSSVASGTITGVTTGTAATTGLTGGGTSGTLSLSVNLGTGADQIPQLDGTGKLATSVLPSHSASLITSGTLAVAQGGTGAATTSSAAQFFAGPTAAGGAPSFRTIASTDLPSGVISTPGTYRSVTVDTYGRVTAGTNPTTLAGYGITDAAPLAGSSNVTTVGTIGSGTWQGTAIGVAYGGTGLSSYTTGDILYASNSTTIGKLADVATGSVLVSGGVGAAPSWSSAPTLNGANISSINASNISSGTVNTARLGTGTADSTTFLRGDGTWSAPGGGAWSAATGGIAYSSGNVGIGTTSPTNLLHLHSTSNGTNALEISTPGNPATYNNAASAINLVTSTSGAGSGSGLGATGMYGWQIRAFADYYATATLQNALQIGYVSSGTINTTMTLLPTAGKVGIGTTTPKSTLSVASGLAVGSYAGANAAPSNSIIVSGNVGIGTPSPGTALDVNGGIRPGTQAVVSGTCNSTLEGVQRYNSTNKVMEFCNGTAWTPFAPQLQTAYITSGTSWSLPAGTNSSTVFKFTVVGAGGAGGAGYYNSGNCYFGGGGGAGGVVVYTVSGVTSVMYGIGAGGTPVNNAAGTAGGNTVLVVNGSTITANGGSGGALATASGSGGGSGGGGSGAGAIVFTGAPGQSSWGAGAGASSSYGGGGAANPGCGVGNSASSSGYGAGGSGGVGANNGGSGSGGLIIVEWTQ